MGLLLKLKSGLMVKGLVWHEGRILIIESIYGRPLLEIILKRVILEIIFSSHSVYVKAFSN
jgi:hypothetical protein